MYDPRKKNGLVDEFKTYIIDSSYEGMHKYSKGLSAYPDKNIVVYWTIYW